MAAEKQKKLDSLDVTHLLKSLERKDEEIEKLRDMADKLQSALNLESDHADFLNDQNRLLKEKIMKQKEKLKVVPHPTTVKKLTAYAEQAQERINELTDCLMFCIELVPITSANSGHLDRLRAIARKQ